MKTCVGLVASRRDAEELIGELTAGGFKVEDLVRVGESLMNGQGPPFHSVDDFFGTDEDPQVKEHYAEGVRRGGVLVSVFAEDEDIERAAEIMLERCVADIEAWLESLKGHDSHAQGALDRLHPAGKEPGAAREGSDGRWASGGRVRIYDHSSLAATSAWGPPGDRHPSSDL